MKKLRSFLILALVMGILMALGVSAATNYLQILTPLLDLLKALMLDLPKNPQYAPVYMKFVIWMIAYGILSMSVRNIPMWKDDPTVQKNAKMVILFMSLAAVVFMPNKTVEGLFYTFSVFILIAFVFFIYQNARQWGADTGNAAIAPIALIAIGILTMLASGLLFSSPPYSTQVIGNIGTIQDILNLVGIILIIIGIISAIAQGRHDANRQAQQAAQQGQQQAAHQQPQLQPVNAQQFQQNLAAFNQAIQNYRTVLNHYINNTQNLPVGRLNQYRNMIVTEANAVYQAANAVNAPLISIQYNSGMFVNLPQNGPAIQAQFNQDAQQYLQSYNQFIQDFSQLAQRF